MDHIEILRAFDELRFNIGKKTLMDFIKGDPNPTIEKNSLDEMNSYGVLYMLERGEIMNLIEQLIENKYLEAMTIQGGFQVLRRTPKGTKEIVLKEFKPKEISVMPSGKLKLNFEEYKATQEDKKFMKNLV